MSENELDQIKYRKEKREQLIKSGFLAYPARLNKLRSHDIVQVLADFSKFIKSKQEVTLIGRVMAIRLHGSICFGNIVDSTGNVQFSIIKKTVADQYVYWKKYIDLGDIISVSGQLDKTNRGEITLLVSEFYLLSKSLLPLPDKRQGVKDIETRLRHRELDLISNQEIRERFIHRSKLITALRSCLDEDGFIEVETPILQSIAGGANAQPFITHHEALNIDLFLRIAPELYLKRLLVGGYEKVYEIGRCFRNEGIDKDHSPEFTQIEFYMAYTDYRDMMAYSEKLLKKIIGKAGLENKIIKDHHEISLNKNFVIVSYSQIMKDYAKLDLDRFPTKEGICQEAEKRNIKIEKQDGRGRIIDKIFKQLIRPNIIEPTHIIDYPIELLPLAKVKEDNPNYVESFQLLILGTELTKGFSEQNDPIVQEQRFKEQSILKEQGDNEAQPFDQDYIQALMHGMPPASGIGIGIDRLVAILTKAATLRESILFPTLKEK
ncbi:MAG: lysine--tRNA ligase [bacterium]